MDKEEPMTELSKLEQEIKEAFKKKGVTASRSDLAKAAAELCRKKIELAFDAGYKRGWAEEQIEIPELEKLDDKVFPNKDQWIKNNI